MPLELPNNFYQQLSNKYDSAIQSGNLKFNGESATHDYIQAKVGESTVDFQLTLLRSLSHRPEKGSVEKDPFAKPEPELTIVENFGHNDEFRLVFNKFPVVPNHFMLITKEFKSQDSPLAPTELEAISVILAKLRESDSTNKWFAFFNCGPQSGASQPHKHIQFMTLPGKTFVPYSEKLSKESSVVEFDSNSTPLQNADIPFSHFVAKIPQNVDQETLTMCFSWLLQRVLNVAKENKAEHISYNFISTTDYMMLVPRSKSKFDKLGINSCGVLGLILCKNEELLDLVKEKGPLQIVSECCYPNNENKTYDEYHY